MLIVMYVCVLDSGTIKGGDRSAVFRASRPKKSASGRESSEVTAARSKSASRGRVGRPSSSSSSGGGLHRVDRVVELGDSYHSHRVPMYITELKSVVEGKNCKV